MAKSRSAQQPDHHPFDAPVYRLTVRCKMCGEASDHPLGRRAPGGAPRPAVRRFKDYRCPCGGAKLEVLAVEFWTQAEREAEVRAFLKAPRAGERVARG